MRRLLVAVAMGGEGERTEEVDVAFVRCGEFEKLAREVLVDWSVLNYC